LSSLGRLVGQADGADGIVEVKSIKKFNKSLKTAILIENGLKYEKLHAHFGKTRYL
jgi:hypothetical protein